MATPTNWSALTTSAIGQKLSTGPVEECTTDYETDYITFKDETGRPNNNINTSLQDTRMYVVIQVHEFEKQDAPSLYLSTVPQTCF